jgi:hypothetical protein
MRMRFSRRTLLCLGKWGSPAEEREKKDKLKDKGLQNGELLQFLLSDENNSTTSAPAVSCKDDT